MSKSVIVENLTKNYIKKEAVKNISFEICENEILGLLGPNGAGKSTIFNLITGLLKPDYGKIFFGYKSFKNSFFKPSNQIIVITVCI